MSSGESSYVRIVKTNPKPAYWISTNLGSKFVIRRLRAELPKVLPAGYQMRTSRSGLFIIDGQGEELLRVWEHDLDLYLRPSSEQALTEILQKCLPGAELRGFEKEREEETDASEPVELRGETP